MRILLLLVILTTQLFLTSFAFDCKKVCNDCITYMAATKYYAKNANTKAIAKEMSNTFCGADRMKSKHKCITKPCTMLSRLVAHIKGKTTPRKICTELAFC